MRCNGVVRLDAMLELADRLGSRTLATGHYARIHHDEPADEEPAAGRCCGWRADPAKDQSYALAALSPDSLARLRFPLGELTKPQVRALAQRAGLAVAGRPDSQDLCFLAGTGQRDFLARHAQPRASAPGRSSTATGACWASTAAPTLFTVGQRRGLGIGAGWTAREPLYVLATDAAANTVTVGSRARAAHPGRAGPDATLHRDGAVVDASRSAIAARACPAASPIRRAGRARRVEVELIEPAERTAPGQIACLYSGDLIVGHGTIASSKLPSTIRRPIDHPR